MVKNGHGFAVTRNKAYDYKHLAFTFRNKKAEPFLVTVEPREDLPPLNSHEGQEFNYVIEGRMLFKIGDITHELEAGDTVVMISDGVLQDDPDCRWLMEYLTGCGEKDPEEIVYEICRRASEFPNHDDCSAIALRIVDAEEIELP
jgi:hypothetical protein